MRIIVWLLLILGATIPGLALAHTVATNNPVSATVHVSPNDSPIPGEVSTLLFEFKDPEGNFSVGECECAVKVLRDGRELFEGNLGQNISDVSSVHAEFSYSFPEIGNYEVMLSGTPREGATFKPFVLRYEVNVGEKSTFFADAEHHIAHFAAGGIFGSVVLGLILFNTLKRPTGSQ